MGEKKVTETASVQTPIFVLSVHLLDCRISMKMEFSWVGNILMDKIKLYAIRPARIFISVATSMGNKNNLLSQ